MERVSTTFLILAALFLMSLAVRLVFELLKETRKTDPTSRPVFILIFLAMCVLWASWFNLCEEDPMPLNLPDPIRWFGMAVVGVGMVLAVGAFIQLRGLENIDHLVTRGLFGKIRHPMYAGFICWIVGWSIYHGAVISFLIGIPALLSVLWWRRLEERRLEVQFGEAYREYRRTTWC